MDTLSTFTCLFLLLFTLTQVSAFVTRLPACKYSANYTVIQKGKYFKGIVNATIPNVSGQKCSLHCTAHESCLFFNHKTDDKKCELMTSHIGILEDTPGWDFVSTNYTNWKLRGPMCRFLRPVCKLDVEYCIDTCETPGYKCIELENVAKGQETDASSIMKSVEGNDNVVDGDLNTFWSSKKQNPAWVRIDLSADYKILFITIVSWHVNLDRLESVTVRIGRSTDYESNEICLDNVDQTDIKEMNYFCKNGRMIGRFVFVSRDASVLEITVGEIKVYTL